MSFTEKRLGELVTRLDLILGRYTSAVDARVEDVE